VTGKYRSRFVNAKIHLHQHRNAQDHATAVDHAAETVIHDGRVGIGIDGSGARKVNCRIGPDRGHGVESLNLVHPLLTTSRSLPKSRMICRVFRRRMNASRRPISVISTRMKTIRIIVVTLYLAATSNNGNKLHH
jgi:hypothetical protein